MFSKSQIQQYKEKFKHFDPHTLQFANLLSDSKTSGFNCPHCGNGTGEDGTGVDWQLINDGYKGYCHKCGKFFDVFDLVADKFRLNVKTQFIEVLQKAVEIFGEKELSSAAKNPAPEKPASPKKPPEDFSALIRRSWANLDKFFADKDSWRGLKKETLVKFGCGFIPDWQMGGFSTPRMIIPTSNFHFLARYVGDSPLNKKFVKIHRGEKDIFGSKKALRELENDNSLPIFAVEGEVDAMSIWQLGFAAIAFSGSNLSNRQQDLLKNFPPNTNFILMLDNDETGRSKSPDVAKLIRRAGNFRVLEKFLDGDKDFNDCLQENPVSLKNTLQKIFDEAKSFFSGVKPAEVEGVVEVTHNFTPKETFDDEEETFMTQIQIPSCPINLTVPKKFLFKPAGIYHAEKSKDKESKGEIIEVLDTATPIVPVRILQKVDCSGKTLELAFYERNSDKWKIFSAPATTIAKSQNITDLADFGVDINSTHARAISEFLSKIQHTGDNLKNIPKIRVREQTGWTDSSCQNFIYPPEGSLDGENFIVQNNGFDYEAKFSTAGTKNEWYFAFSTSYLGKKMFWVRYALGLTLAAPLVRLCNSRNWQGVLIAPSGSSKSAVAKLAVSIFGNPDKLHTTFNGTLKSLDELATRLNDLPCWIDEFQSADEFMRKNFSTFIYNYAEGSTRSRLTKSADMRKKFSFSGTRLFTSEQVILHDNASQGAFNRIIQVKNFEPLADEVGRMLHETLSRNYGHYGKMFIDYISLHREKIQQTFDDVQKKYLPLNFITHHLQQLALVYTALEFFFRMLKEDRESAELDGDEEADWIDMPSPLEYLESHDIHAFRDLLPSPQDSNNILRGKQYLAESLVTHARRYDVFSETTGELEEAVQAPALGCKLTSSGDIAFYPKAINDFLLESKFPPAPDLMEGLKREGLLNLPADGRGLKKSQRIGSKGPLRVYLVKKAAFDFDS